MQIGTLEAEVKAAKANLDALRLSSGEASTASAAAAAIEHEALLKAKADLEAIRKEAEALKEKESILEIQSEINLPSVRWKARNGMGR